MHTIYCIPGLGADEGAFKHLDLSFANPAFIKWITPHKNETLQAYAMRLKKEFIHETDPIIFGLSLGGMIAVEIAKTIPSAKAIIISSAKTKNEIPSRWKFFKLLPLYKILPEWSVRRQSILRYHFLGAKSNKTKNYVNHVAKHANVIFYRWAIGAIINWQNKTAPLNVVHIHGTDDRLLPYRFINSAIPVTNGGHLMIIENAEEVSGLLKTIVLN